MRHKFGKMKTIEQIAQYTKACAFPDEDWQRVLNWCKERYGGGKLHRCQVPLSESTYEQFLEWVDNGFGSGDMVKYGNTQGIVGLSTPDYTFLAAYCAMDGSLVVKKSKDQSLPDRVLKIDNLNSLSRLNKEDEIILAQKAFVKGYKTSCTHGLLTPLYTPKKFSWASFKEKRADGKRIGIYLESKGLEYHFLAFYDNGEMKFDCWVDSECTPLKPSTMTEIHDFESALSKAGYSFNAVTNQLVKLPKRAKNTKYWYVNESFDVRQDVDLFDRASNNRFSARNYFTNYAEAVSFAWEVKKLRDKGESD